MIIMVTGASSGIGRETAKKFLKEGHQVIGSARRQDKLEEISKNFENFFPLPLDIRSLSDIEKAFKTLPEEFSEIDVLVNNAGLALGLERADMASLEDWQTMIDTNIIGLVALTKFVIKGMVERNRGHIINIGSTAGTWPYKGGNVYGATKAFVKQFTLGLKADFQGTRLRFTDIEPGLTMGSEFSLIRFHNDNQKAESVYKGLEPLEAKDIAESIYWVSMLPSHININYLEMMPVCQSFAGLSVNKL